MKKFSHKYQRWMVLALIALLMITGLPACAAAVDSSELETPKTAVSIDITGMSFEQKLALLTDGSILPDEFKQSAQSDFDVILGFIGLLANKQYETAAQMVNASEAELLNIEYLSGLPVGASYTTGAFNETRDGSVVLIETPEAQLAVTAYKGEITGVAQMNVTIGAAYQEYQEKASGLLSATQTNSGSRDYLTGAESE